MTLRLLVLSVGLVLSVLAAMPLWQRTDGTPALVRGKDQMIEAQERELRALRETVAIYKAEDEKRRTKTWEGDDGIYATMSVKGGAVQYAIKGRSIDRETFYRWLDDYMLKTMSGPR